jgi:hypothetical protein
MNVNGKAESGFGIGDFALRFAAAFALVVLTFNPTDYCYSHWLRTSLVAGEASAVHALAGIALLIGWTVFLRTAWSSLGKLGMILAGAFLAAVVWVLVEFDILAIESMSGLVWIVLVCIAAILAIGMAWGHWKRQASGQVEVDDVES